MESQYWGRGNLGSHRGGFPKWGSPAGDARPSGQGPTPGERTCNNLSAQRALGSCGGPGGGLSIASRPSKPPERERPSHPLATAPPDRLARALQLYFKRVTSNVEIAPEKLLINVRMSRSGLHDCPFVCSHCR